MTLTIITNFFNVKLNPFIAKYGRIEKDGDITLTGGLMQINRKKVHKFKQYCDWLESYRKELFYIFPVSDMSLSIDILVEQLDPLVQFFVNLSILNEICPDQELDENLLKPLKSFFKEWDEYTNSDYLEKNINLRRSMLPDIKIEIKNLFIFPLRYTYIDVLSHFKFVFNELPQIRIYKKILLRTDDQGIIKIKVPEGEYMFKLKNYKKQKYLTILQDTELKFNVFKINPF